MPTRQLATYLNDHLMMAAAGDAMFTRVASSHSDRPWAEEIANISREVHEDIASLRHLMHSLGVMPNPVRMMAGRVGELTGRFKPNGAGLSRTALTDLIEVEALRTAVVGKWCLWRALQELPEVSEHIDLVALEDRAAEQAERLDEVHAQVAAEVVPEIADEE